MKKRNHLQVMLKLVGMVKPLIGYMILAIFMGLIGHLCASFLTILSGYAILDYLGFPVSVSMKGAFISMGVFALLRGILRYTEQACNHFIAFKLLALIRGKVFHALRKLCPAKLEGRDKGNLITVITSDIELLEVFYAHTISPAAIATLFTIILCVFIGSFHPLLGLLALAAYLTVGIVIPLIISKISGEDGMLFRTKSGELGSFVLDSLRGLSETLQYGQGEKRLTEMNQQTDKLSIDEERMKRTTGKNMAVTGMVILLFDLCMLFGSALLYEKGAVTFEGVLLPVIALMSSFGPVTALANLGSTLQNTFAAGNRVLDILEESPIVEEITGEKEIVFENASAEQVSFSYKQEINFEDKNFGKEKEYGILENSQTDKGNKKQENNTYKEILSDVSIEVPKNGIIGISGKSGSGKSTLLKLFMRFFSVQQGEVKISKISVEKINTANLREMESFMTQETCLFHDSIANNLRIAKLDATQEEIETACKKASIHDFIMGLPNGYETSVGELGDTLSGGEKQRLGLARAFLHNAPFLLLDEPTSNLDSLNEAVILRSLHQERKGKTILLISHRQSTMRIADKVYSVENGRMS